MRFSDLMTKALHENGEKVDMLTACKGFINPLEDKREEWEADLEIGSTGVNFPTSGDDYTLISIYLKEKGSIKKDIGFIIEDLLDLGFVIDGDKYIDSDNQCFSWEMKYTKSSFKGKHPRLTLNVSAKKSNKCVQVETGETRPVYKMECIDE